MAAEIKGHIPYGANDAKQEHGLDMLEGRLVSMTGTTLVMINPVGKECSLTLAKDAKLTCDGNVCNSSALKDGSRIRVTTKKSDRKVATCVETIEKEAKFAYHN